MEVEEGMKEMENFLNFITEQKMTFANYREIYLKLEGMRSTLSGTIVAKQEDRARLNREIKQELKNIEEFKDRYIDSPLYKIFEKLQVYASTLNEEMSWRIMFGKIYKEILEKNINLLDSAKGLDIAKEVYENVRKIVEVDRASYKEIFFNKIEDVERRLHEKMEMFVKRIEWADEQYRIIAEAVGKDKGKLKEDYERKVLQLVNEKKALEEKLEKLQEKDKQLEKSEEAKKEKIEKEKEQSEKRKGYNVGGRLNKKIFVPTSLIEKIQNASIDEGMVYLSREFPELRKNQTARRELSKKIKNPEMISDYVEEIDA